MTRYKLLTIVTIFLFSLAFFLPAKKIIAQNAISLSISPPLLELTIQPGKQFKQLFTISNLSGDLIITPRIVYFAIDDELKEINLTENPAPDWVFYDKEPFNLKGQEKSDFYVTFSPPIDSQEVDHYLTLVFETGEAVDLLNQNSVNYKSRIASNILLTISKDGSPKKQAEIVQFSAPKIIDSLLSNISYQITIKNSGNSYWKPRGKIIVNNEFLKIAPQNILSQESRNIYCLDNESLVDCSLKKKFRIGKIVSKLEFYADDNPKIYKAEAVTYALPISLVLSITVLGLTFIKKNTIFRLWGKNR